MSVYRTLSSWNSNGRHIIKGEKSKLRCPDTKLPLFEKSQTTKMKNSGYRDYNGHGSYTVREYDDWSDFDTVLAMEYS